MRIVLIAALALVVVFPTLGQSGPIAKLQDPFQSVAKVRVLLFVRTDCPITNRYAPELKRIAAEFQEQSVEFWLIYPDKTETPEAIERHRSEYQLPGTPVRDPEQTLEKRAQATVSPQAAVFDHAGRLLYSGRIDNRYISFGQSRPEPSTHDLELAIRAVLTGKTVAQPRTKAIGCYLADLR
jgi:hypothetical protein